MAPFAFRPCKSKSSFFCFKENWLVRPKRLTDTPQLSADTSQEKGCSAGSAKEADAVHHDSLKRETAHVSRFS
jgi:hypothetical protein